MQVCYAIIFVSDMNRSVAFYRDVVGLPLRFQTPGWTEFETGAATIALHKSTEPATPLADPDHLPAGRCRPGIRVANLDEFHKRMLAKNVPVIAEPRDMFGARIAQYADPDGLSISVSEQRR